MGNYDSIVAGIGSAIARLSSAQKLSIVTYRARSLFTGRKGCPPFYVSEDRLVFLVGNGFTVLTILVSYKPIVSMKTC